MLKMKPSGFFTFALLSISILSFGLTGAVNAQLDLPLSVNTDSSSYTTGSTIEISGMIKNLSESSCSLLRIRFRSKPAKCMLRVAKTGSRRYHIINQHSARFCSRAGRSDL